MRKKNSIKGILFDYGGTLDSNAHHWSEVIWKGYLIAQIPVSKDEFRESYVFGEQTLAQKKLIDKDDNFYTLLTKKIEQEFFYLISQKYWIPSEEEKKARCQQVVEHCYSMAKNCTQNSKKILENLSSKYHLAIVSNFYGNLHSVLSDFKMSSYFEKIVESAIVGISKPDNRIFSEGLSALGFLAEEVVVVGDSYSKDILPASQIGCKTIWLKGSTWESESFDLTVPNIIITSIEQLPKAIKSL